MTKWNKSAYAITAAAILAAAASLAAYAAAEPPQPGFPAGQEYTTSWRYVGSPEEGARFYHDEWFQVLPDGSPDDAAYQDTAQRWYYSDNGTLCKNRFKTINEDTYFFDKDGILCRNQFRTIESKRYLFDKDGRMQTGLKLVLLSPNDYEEIIDIIDPELYNTRDKFIQQYNSFAAMSGKDSRAPHVASFYFGSDGVMQTKSISVLLNNETCDFQFADSGAEIGQGITGVVRNRLHLGGLRIKAENVNHWEVAICFKDGTIQQYTMESLLDRLGITQQQVTVSNGSHGNNRDFYFSNGSFKDLIESNIGAVEAYYVYSPSGICKENGTVRDMKFYIVIEQYEIVRIYREK